MRRLLTALALLVAPAAAAAPHHDRTRVNLGSYVLLSNHGDPSYDPNGIKLDDGGVFIAKPTYGWEGTATGLSVIIDGSQPIPQVNGNYGRNPAGRSLAYAADHVGIYAYAAVQPPVAIVDAPNFTYANDPATPFEVWSFRDQDGTGRCPGAPNTWLRLQVNPATNQVEAPCDPRTPAQGTLLRFDPPLAPETVARLRTNMLIETRDNNMMAAITAWDAGGSWIKVDTWTLLVGDLVQTGRSPESFGPQGRNGQSIDINPFHGTYVMNGGVTIPAHPYINPETKAPGNAFLGELYVENDYADPGDDEFRSSNDRPWANGFDIGCAGTFGCGSAFRTGGRFFRGLDCANGFPSYGCVVAEPGRGNGPSLVDQRTSGPGILFHQKVNGTVYSVDRSAGATRQGIGAAHGVWHLPLKAYTDGTGPWMLTQDGGSNGLPPMTAPMVATVHGVLDCWDDADSITWFYAGHWSVGRDGTSLTPSATQASILFSSGNVAGWRMGAGADGMTPYIDVGGMPAGVTCTGDAEYSQTGIGP